MDNKAAAPPAAATPDEVVSAYEKLSTADLGRLRSYARLRVRISGRAALGEWQDLLSEALTRTLDGRRNWKKDISLTQFLIGVMQSISSNDWIAPFEKTGKYILRDADLPTDTVDDLEESATERAAAGEPSPEDDTLAKQEAETYRDAAATLRNYFAGDQTILEVIDGVMAGLTGPEIKELADIDQKRLESSMKAIRRGATKLFGSFENIGKDRSRGN